MRASELRRIRKDTLRLSQTELGERCDLTRRTISRYESGRAKIPDSMIAIVGALVIEAKRKAR